MMFYSKEREARAKKYSALTIVMVVIFFSFGLGCASFEFAYSNSQLLNHKIHYQDGETRLDCAFCYDEEQRQIQ